MAADNVRIARAIEGLEKSAELMAKSQEKIALTLAKLQHPAFRGRESEAVHVFADDVSTTFTFEHPEIEGRTSIYRQNDGLVSVHIIVEPEHAERFMELLTELPVEGLVVEAIAPSNE